jgi:hypothetical protein
MGTVHELLERQGKRGAIEAGLDRELIEAAVSYMSDESPGRSFPNACGWSWNPVGDRVGKMVMTLSSSAFPMEATRD